MQIIKNSEDKIICVIFDASIMLEFNEIWGKIVADQNILARKKGVALMFSPAVQRASYISQYLHGDENEIKKRFPLYNASLEEELKTYKGIIIVPGKDTTGHELKNELIKLINEF